MKKTVSLLIAAILCLLSTAGLAAAWTVPGNSSSGSSGGSGSSYSVTARLIDDLATRSGPSTSYTGCGSYKMKGQTVTVLSRAYDHGGVLWVEIEFSYGGGYRRAWTGAKRLDISSSQLAMLPEADFTTFLGYGTINSYTIPRFGPGTMYSTYGDRDYRQGNQVAVIDSENGYYLVESYHTDGNVLRCWVPSSSINMN